MHEEEEESRYVGGDSGSRSGARTRMKPRSNGSHQLLLMDCVGDADGVKETVPLPDYERLPSPPLRLADDPDPNNLPEPRQRLVVEQSTSPPRQQQKPAVWRLVDYVVRSRHRSSGGSSDADSKSSGEEASVDGGEDGKRDNKMKKKRSSWLPDPDRRWPVQGFY